MICLNLHAMRRNAGRYGIHRGAEPKKLHGVMADTSHQRGDAEENAAICLVFVSQQRTKDSIVAKAIERLSRRWRRMDRLLRLMIANWIVGMLVGIVCATLLLAFDFAGIRSLLWRSDMPITGALMLMAAFAFSFGGLVCAAAVMRGDDDDDHRGPPRGGRKSKLVSPQTLAFAAGARRSRASR